MKLNIATRPARNLYRPRPVVSDHVNIDSLIDWTPGSPIRLRAGARPIDNYIAWLQVPNVTDGALTADPALLLAQAQIEIMREKSAAEIAIKRDRARADVEIAWFKARQRVV